ncbi:MAG TPA: IS110 family transposase [Negativicutes bacterium]|nr:IS110 family transposase [Negativicutes bacterium]
MKFKYADKQNEKIKAITEGTLVIGCDIAKATHVARAFDFRGIELGKSLQFDNTQDGFNSLALWAKKIMFDNNKPNVMLGIEPTGHYWLSLSQFINESKMAQLVIVNSYHTKKAKELDDNSPTKDDVKDAKTIAKLVLEGRYSIAHIPTGDYAELRAGMCQRQQLQKGLQAIKGLIITWLDRYFPEFTSVYKSFEGKAALTILKHFSLPQDILRPKNETEMEIWRKQIVRYAGVKKTLALEAVARRTVGLKSAHEFARMEIGYLLMQYEIINEQLTALMEKIKAILVRLPEAKAMLDIPGIGVITVAGFLAEVGDLKNYRHWRQIIRLAGLNLKTNSSGKHKGKTGITKRGRHELRALLYRCALALIANNPEFNALHQHLTTRKENPLKGMQSVIAICGKLIRILFAIGKNQSTYRPEKAFGALIQKQNQAA